MTKKTSKMLNVAEVRFHFYECAEAEDVENMCDYFETLYYHYQQRGKRIKELNIFNKKLNEEKKNEMD
jgi:hypothetical protein